MTGLQKVFNIDQKLFFFSVNLIQKDSSSDRKRFFASNFYKSKKIDRLQYDQELQPVVHTKKIG